MMRSCKLGLIVAATLMAGCAMAWAQQSPSRKTPARPSQNQPAVAPSAPAPDVPAASAAPQRTETVTYDSWTVTCNETVETRSRKTCSALMKVSDQKSGDVLLVWLVGRNNEGALLTVMRTVTGVLLQKGVELKLGNAAVRRLNYVKCDPIQCEAALPMDAAMVKDFSAAGEAVATVYATDGRAITFTMPIKGADRAVASIGG
jgi:invasion protein IalB